MGVQLKNMIQTQQKKQNIFQIKFFVIVFATISAVTWASAFPLIKIGFWEFQITSADTGAKTLFAGIRFFMAGIVTLVLAKFRKRKFQIKTKQEAGWLAFFGLINTTFHYFFFYMGLSYASGSRSAIFDSLGTFFLIILACICFKEEHMTWRKAIGCLLGFGGVVLINIGNGSSLAEGGNLLGEGMLLLSATCSAFGGIITRIVTKKTDPLIATGFSLAFGGVLLILVGIMLGGSLDKITPMGIIVLFLLVLVSAVGFSLYNQLICYNPVGEIAIFNSFIPILGTILSCVILGEKFMVKYLAAGIMVVAGVYVVHHKPKREA